MPEVGEIKKAREVGKKGTSQYIWHICKNCGKGRWVHSQNGEPRSFKCKSCAGRLRPQPRGENSKIWKGGRFKRNDGYILIWIPPDNFFRQMTNPRGYVMEHRLVMAKKLGRCLHRWELVHHLNGIRDDNPPENLAITMKQYHEKHTFEVILKTQVQILENKIDKLLEGQRELKQEIRLLRLENKQLREGERLWS